MITAFVNQDAFKPSCAKNPPDENDSVVKISEAGIKVVIPSMPDIDHPDFINWLPFFSEAVGEVGEDDILVGHSIGRATVLRFLESLNEGQKVGGVVMVACLNSSSCLQESTDADSERYSYNQYSINR